MNGQAPHPDEALLGFVYDELSAADAARVQAHLDGCPTCARTVEGYRAMRRAASALPRELQTEAGLPALLAAAEGAARRARRGRVVRTLGALGGVAAAAVALLVLSPSPHEALPTAARQTPVGALAENDVPALRKREAPESPLSRERAAAPAQPPAAAPPAEAKAAKSADGLRRLRTEPALDAAGAQASAATAAAPGPALGTGQKQAAAAQSGHFLAARGAAAPVLPAMDKAAPSEDAPAPSAAAPALALATAVDAGSAADEARRRALLLQLPGAEGPVRLSLLAELCALDVRLGRRADAEAVCGSLAQQYPGTAEASAAQHALEALPPR